MSLEALIDDARNLFVENENLKYAEDPVGYNTALAKLMQGLKKEKGAGVSAVRQGYKGAGAKAYGRQIWVKMPDHERGGPDVWLENGYVKVGGIIAIPNNIPHLRKYGEDPPKVVYNWIADTLKQVQAWIDAKYAQPPQSPQTKPESIMNAEMSKKLEALRHELEADFALDEEGSTPQYKGGNVPAKNKMGVQDLKHAPVKAGETPQYKGGNVPAKNKMGIQDLKHSGSGHPPPPKKVKDSIAPSKMEAIPGFRRLAGLEDLRRLAVEETDGAEANEGGKPWIANAIKKPGALHKQMGVPSGEKIPAGKLDKAAHAGGKLGQRARLAKTLRKF